MLQVRLLRQRNGRNGLKLLFYALIKDGFLHSVHH